jgi:hypothetical protein
MTPEDVKRLKQQLSPEWFINHTEIFQADPGWPDPVTSRIIADRFKEYWNTWVKEELSELFNQIEQSK